MTREIVVDASFDFRSDAGGRDPDQKSPTLRRYHRLLWSRELPGGTVFELDDHTREGYLHHKSDVGEFSLASDSIIPTFTKWKRLTGILNQVPDAQKDAFLVASYSIGGATIFPSNKVDGKLTINGARGLSPKIADRFDLTLECIRRHYRRDSSPLRETLDRYSAFFALFETFPGYVNFFEFHDLVNNNSSAVRFLLPFDDFRAPAVPSSLSEYQTYRRASIDFVDARNKRLTAMKY
jgi:hypothetical protein